MENLNLQKMGEGDYGRIQKGFCPLFDFGEGRPSLDFSYFSISFLPKVFGQQLSKVLCKKDGINCISFSISGINAMLTFQLQAFTSRKK